MGFLAMRTEYRMTNHKINKIILENKWGDVNTMIKKLENLHIM
jgi:hypothetical protein